MMSKCDDIWPFNDRRLAIQTTVFSAWIFTFSSRLKIQWFDRNYVSIQLPTFRSLFLKWSWNWSILAISSSFFRIKGQNYNILEIEFSWRHTSVLYSSWFSRRAFITRSAQKGSMTSIVVANQAARHHFKMEWEHKDVYWKVHFH